MQFSPRTPADLEPNQLSLLVDRLRAEERALVDLTATNPTAVGLAYPTAELADALAAGAGAPYQPSPRGLLYARRAVADFLASRAEVDPDHVFLTASTSEAYGFLFKLLCAPGDQVLVPRPSYPLFHGLCELDAARVESYSLGPPPGFALDPDGIDFEQAPRARALIVVSPNNPTGSVVPAAGLAELSRRCARRGVALIADEVFADYPAAGQASPASALAAGGGLRFALGGLSKSCGLPHYKLGWIAVAGPDALRDEAIARLEHVADAYLSASGPVMHALPRLLAVGEVIRRGIAERVEASRAAAARALAGSRRARLLPADGGWSAVIALGAGLDEEAVCLELAERRGVLVQPGYFYDFDDDPYAVVSLLPAPADVERGLAALRELVES
jgi:alanine-synthesizing transaminase